MIPPTPLRTVLSRVCARLLDEHADVLLLATLTDRSFEEGARSRAFAESVASFRRAGLDELDLARLAGGLNGLLEALLRKETAVRYVQRNVSRVPDHFLADPETGRPGLAEVKQIYDLTFARYYDKVREDREKLLAERSARGDAALAQIVFFFELPEFSHPAGRWYGHKDCPARSHYRVYPGIHRQYDVVRSVLGPATWPEEGLHVRPWSAEEIERRAPLLATWMASIFTPAAPWTFRPDVHLRGCAAGAAIWEW